MKGIYNYFFLLLLSICFQADSFAQEQSNNILFIAVDDLKPLLSNYGHTEMHTPNFDRLAKMGVTFHNAHVQQAVCGPSRASIMTGTYPDQSKVWDLHTDFRKSNPSLHSMPEYLISQGYESTGVGKIYHKGSSAKGHDGKSWSIPHDLPEDWDPAFDEPIFNTYQDPNTKAQMKNLVKELKANGKKGGLRTAVFKQIKPSTESADVSDESYQDGVYTKEAIKRMRNLSKGDKPFFLAVGYQRPHLPFVAPTKYWDLYDREKINLAPLQSTGQDIPRIAYHKFGELRSYSDIPKSLEFGETLSEAKQKELIHGYMACVSYIDAQLGKLLDAVEELGLLKNTNIVLWGDHGFHLGDHTLWCKHSNFEQATRIPLMFAGPGVAKGVDIDQPVELLDVFPTLFDLAGVAPSLQAEGVSLRPLLDTNKKTKLDKDYAISQFSRKKTVKGYSIRTDKYRYTEWHDNNYNSHKNYDEENIMGYELYDYENDPTESRNFVDAASHQKIKEELNAKLVQHLKSKQGGNNKKVDSRLPTNKHKKIASAKVSQEPRKSRKNPALKNGPPNVLFIIADDLGYHDMSSTGSVIYDTPELDELASSALTFTNAYSSYPRCTPSRYGLITATYPVNEDHGHLASIPTEQIFINHFKEKGYSSSYVGKWHLGGGASAPKGIGFDHSYAAGTAGGTGSQFYPFNTTKSYKKGPDKIIDDVTETCQEGDYLADILTNETIKFIKSANREQPFFAMLSHYAVHTPLEAKAKDKLRNAEEIATYDYGSTPEYIQEGQGRRKMRQDDADYAGMVENLDENIGRLMATLEELGIADNTIVVFTSDHGGLSNDGNKRQRHLATTNFPLKAGKGHLYEGGIRVPLFIKWKGQIKPQVDQENIILGMDLMPTLLEMTIKASLPSVDGRSFAPVLAGKESWKERTVFWQSRKARPHSTGDSKCTAMRSGKFKLLHFYGEDRYELYDLSKDASEEHNIITALPKVTTRLKNEMKTWKDNTLTPENLNRKKANKS